MSRTKGLLIPSIYDPAQRKPFDARQLVSKREDLINPSTWIPNGLTAQMNFNGMLTAVSGDSVHNGVYYLTDRSKITEENYNNYISAVSEGSDIEQYFAMWIKLANVDELAEFTAALNELSDKIDNIEIPESSSVETYAEYSQFPTEGRDGVLYTALDKASSYVYFNGSYVCVGNTNSGELDICIIHGGTAKQV